MALSIQYATYEEVDSGGRNRTRRRTVVEVAATNVGEELVTIAGSAEPVTMGMHGALAEFYGAEGNAAMASSTLDYVVAAVAACLTGTLARALASRGVAFEKMTARGTGMIAVRERVPTIERIEVGGNPTPALGLCAEVGDFERFERPAQLMSYLGLVPSEQSSGERRRQGSITKSGSRHARRLLVEAAWHYRRAPAKGANCATARRASRRRSARSPGAPNGARTAAGCASIPNAASGAPSARSPWRGSSVPRAAHPRFGYEQPINGDARS